MNKELKERLKFLKKQKTKDGLYKGPKPKKHKKVDYVTLYETTLTNFQLHLFEMICVVNGIPVNYYMSNGVLHKDLLIDTEFVELSALDWESEVDIHSLTFHARFVTQLLYKLARNTHKVVKGVYRTLEQGEKKHRSYYNILTEWIIRVDLFVSTYLTRDASYHEHLESILEMLIVAEDKDTQIVYQLRDVKRFLKDNVKFGSRIDSGLLCNNIMKMACVLATESMKVKKTASYVENIKYYDLEEVENQIGSLGYAILSRREKERMPLIYSAFVESGPEMYTKLRDTIECPELVVGIQALYLLKVFIDDVRVSRYIDSIMM